MFVIELFWYTVLVKYIYYKCSLKIPKHSKNQISHTLSLFKNKYYVICIWALNVAFKRMIIFLRFAKKKREKLHLEIALQDSTRHFHYHANLLANTCKIFGKRKKFAFCISTYLRGSSTNSYSQTQNIASKK